MAEPATDSVNLRNRVSPWSPPPLLFSACARQPFKRGDTLCPIRNTLPGVKAYSSVQVLPDPPVSSESASTSTSERRHIELNSDLLYVNHSCDPNVVFDVNGREAHVGEEDESGRWEGRWRVRAEKDIAVGEVSPGLDLSECSKVGQRGRCEGNSAPAS